MKRTIKTMSEAKAWGFVVLGGLLEIIWASGFKYESIPSIVVLISLIASFDLIIKAAKILPVGNGLLSLRWDWEIRNQGVGT